MAVSEAGRLPVDQVSKAGRKRRRLLLVSSLLFIMLVAILWSIGVFGGNVRAIEPGRAYRSATLTGVNYTGLTARLVGNDLDSVLKRDRIGTVICLRSGSPADDWYRQEIETCRRDNVVHEDVPMSARSLPPPAALTTLLELFEHARYPILLHCQAGADRTGLASTIYAHLYEKQPLDMAQADELTWRYGHFPVDKTRAMDDFFNLYRRDARGLNMRDWIYRRYPQIYAETTAGNTRLR
jgi:protein tyrosine/serine phosphatase